MVDLQENPYKGYHVVTSSSGGKNPPYTASFGIALIQPDGTNGLIEGESCGTSYQTEQEAHIAANIAARERIDSILKKE